MEKDIDRIQKNADTDIVIRVDDFGGRRGVTIREFVKSDKYSGFTKAGTRIPADKFKIFKAAINSIDETELLEPVAEQQPIQPSPPQSSASYSGNGQKKPVSKPYPEKAKPKAEKKIDSIDEQEF